MSFQKSLVSHATVCFLLCCAQASADDGKPDAVRPIPSNISKFDLQTRDELVYSHFLEPLVEPSDVSKWKWVNELVNHLGKWAAGMIDTGKISEAIHHGLAIDGQKPLAKLESLVKECAVGLRVQMPSVIVRNAPETRAYVVDADQEHFFVITSGMLKLYDGADDELKFIIGRELGHLKCEHLKLRKASIGLIGVLVAADLATAPKDAFVLPTLVAGRMFTWTREAEISADRAGLLCCGSIKIANSALIRLLHGLDRNASILDPGSPEFDAKKIVEQFVKWENEPFLKFVTYVQSQSRTAPYIAERLAALQLYAASNEYQHLFDNSTASGDPYITIVEEIELLGVAEPEAPIYPYVSYAVHGKTPAKTTAAARGTSAKWPSLAQVVSEKPGEPIFFEVYDRGIISDTFTGGFAIFPKPPLPGSKLDSSEVYSAQIMWDWKDKSSITRTGVAKIKVRYAAVSNAKP